MLGFLNAVIRWSFYLLFFLVPIIFTGNTSELFEFNKMWLTFGITLVIAAAWISRMLIERQIKILKTPLTLFMLLFLLSQIAATIFSIDVHTSLWGYYSRFNGGLFSLLSYGFLYFAFVSTIARRDVMKYIYTGLASALFVALWGLPSHFGYDPTCLVFRGTFDVSCWTFAFQPKVRIFSTLGQPDWLAAYLVYMIPLSTALGFIFWKAKKKLFASIAVAATILFYADLLFTKARSGFAAFGVSLGIFVVLYVFFEWRSFAKHALARAIRTHGFFITTLFIFALVTFLIGAPIAQLEKFSLQGFQNLFAAQKAVNQALQQKQTTAATPSAIPVQEFGGTDSGKIRLFVWQGAWEIFLHNPIFGTGVETFAYSYYAYRPAGHNLTSEWDYLYNKAHNEYLNYLATTGIFGFATYMALVIASIWLMAYGLWQTKKINEQEYDKANPHLTLYALRFMLFALLTGYVSILVTNFFGFSVVIMNIYLFLTPAFAILLLGKVSQNNAYVFGEKSQSNHISEVSWIAIALVWIVCTYLLIVLFRFWLADVSYAMGHNLDQANEFSPAYSFLHDAVSTRPSEPTFQDELAVNDAVLATALYQQKDATTGARLRDEAISFSDSLTTAHPNVITYWKSRVKIFYTLSQIDPQYLSQALIAIEKAAQLAPTDAKVWYNLGLLYDQTGSLDKAIPTLEQTVKLKPDYRDAYYALALFYRQKALGGSAANKQVVDQIAQQKAVAMMHFILDNFGQDPSLTETLKSWGEE